MSLVAAILMLAVIVRLTYHFWQRHDLDGWGFTRAKFLIWMTKGLVLPAALWMVLNLGLSARFPPLLFAIHAAKVSGRNWLPHWLALATPTVLVVGSYWSAATLVWLVALHIMELEFDRRELVGGMIAWTLLLSPVAVFIVLGTGLAGIGLAAALLLAPVLSELLALGNPRKRRILPVYSRALEKIRAGKYAAAEKEVIRQLEKCDTDFDGWMLLAELYAFQFSDLEEAERLVHQVCGQPEATRAQMSDALHRLATWQLKAGGDKAAATRSLLIICETFPGTHYGDVARQRISRLHGPSSSSSSLPVSLAFWVVALLNQALAATGPIRIAEDFPHSFQYQSGERFFPMGDTAYFMIAQPTNVIGRFIDSRRAHRFNFIRMMPMARGHWPFGGTPLKPDYTVINQSAMEKLDWVFDHAASKGMNIELIIFGYDIEQGEGLWANATNQNLWIDTLVKRYQERPNLFMWTVANEFERYPDGRYSFTPDDVEWARAVAARIRHTDTTHPIGAHPSVWITRDDPFPKYGDFTQRRPQVVWPLWEGSCIDLNITQNNEGVQPRTWGNFNPNQRGITYYPTNWQGVDYPVSWTTNGWDFEAAGMEDCIAEDWAHGKPVLNTEFGYQDEPGGESTYCVQTRQFTTLSTVRKKAWKIATAGAYFSAGYINAAASYELTTKEVDHFRPEQLETLYDFFTTRTEYWKMAPHLELVASHNVLLALPGTEYVAYFPRGGTNTIKLEAGQYAVEWLRAETGQYFPMPAIAVPRGSREFVPPNNPGADWVLHLGKGKRTNQD